MPDVSVVIPTYNRLNFLKKAVASCFEGNDEIDVEVIVVDDGSTDGTREWLLAREREEIRPLLRDHEGAQQARNAGLEATQGETVKFLDSDDYLYPGVLTEQWSMLTTAEADVCYGPIDITDGRGKVQDHRKHLQVDDLMGAIAFGSITTYPHVFLYRRDIALRERWRPEVPFHQDTAYALEIGIHGPQCVRSDSRVGVHRAHSGKRITTTAKATSAAENTRYKFTLLHEALKRRLDEGQLSRQVKERLLHGLWTEAHKIAVYSFSDFRKMWNTIREIEPAYEPNRSSSLLRVLDRYIGVEVTEGIINLPRSIKK